MRMNLRRIKIKYAYKFLILIMLMAVSAGCIELIYKGVNYFGQEKFFAAKKDYYYITVGGNLEGAKKLLNEYYTRAVKDGKEISLVDLGRWQTDAEYIFADQGAKDYITANIPEIESRLSESKVYYLVPKGNYDKKFYEDMQNIYYAYFETECEYEIIEYEQTARIMAVSNTGSVKSVLKKNPVIILNNTGNVRVSDSSILYITNASMFSFTEEEFENIALQNAYHDLHYRTNVYENYRYFRTAARRGILVGVVFLSVFVALEGLMVKNILKPGKTDMITACPTEEPAGFLERKTGKKIMAVLKRVREKGRKKQLKKVLVALGICIIVFHMFWVYNYSLYIKYVDGLNELIKFQSYSVLEDDFIYHVKFPSYLSFVGNLAVSTKDSEYTLII